MESKLRESFEHWASSYWAQGLTLEWMAEYDAYADEGVQTKMLYACPSCMKTFVEN